MFRRIQFNDLRCLLRLRFLFQRAFRLFNDGGESFFVGHGQVGEDFAIQNNAGRFQTFSQAAVRHAIGASSGIQPLNPQHAEIAFSCFAIAVGPILTFHGRVFGVTEKFRSASAITFRFS